MRYGQIVSEFLNAAKESPRIFFAPIMGAFQAIRAEVIAPRPARIHVRSQNTIHRAPARKIKR